MILRPLYGMFARNSLINTYNNSLAESKEKIHEYDDEELYEIYSLLARQEAGRSSFGSQQMYLQKESSMRIDLIKKHSDYIASHPEIEKRREGFRVASLRYPVFCSLSFTDQFRKLFQKRIDEATDIEKKFDRDQLMRCYKNITLAPVGYSVITCDIEDKFCWATGTPGENKLYTYFQSMLAAPWWAENFWTDLPTLLFMWVRASSKSKPFEPVMFFNEYPDDDLKFEILTEAPYWFPRTYKDMPPHIKAMLKMYEPDLYRGCNEKKYFHDSICDPNMWKDWLVPVCENIIRLQEALDKRKNGKNKSADNPAEEETVSKKNTGSVINYLKRIVDKSGIDKSLVLYADGAGEGYPDLCFEISSAENADESISRLNEKLESFNTIKGSGFSYIGVIKETDSAYTVHADCGDAKEKDISDLIRLIFDSDGKIGKLTIE